MNKAVVWIGAAGVTRAELAVACSTCNVGIGVECSQAVFPMRHKAHAARADYACLLGFRTVETAGPLFPGARS